MCDQYYNIRKKNMEKYAHIKLSEDWYNDRLGVSFTEDFWTDPVQRTGNYRQIAYETALRHPGIGVGSLDPAPDPQPSDAYSHRFMAALFGCGIVYKENQAPAALPLEVDMDDLARLEVPVLQENRVFRKAMEDAATLRGKYGFVNGGINMGGPLNVAVTVFGEEFLAACACEPDIARHVLSVIAETETRLIYEYCSVVQPGYPTAPFHYGLGNCPAIMLSPALYREVVLPGDLRRREQCAFFSIHHCGVFDRYAEIYSILTPCALDVGANSDYRHLRKYFPQTPCSYIVDNGQIEGRSRGEIDETVRAVVEDGGPPEHITLLRAYGLSKNATDENLTDFRTSAARQGLVPQG